MGTPEAITQSTTIEEAGRLLSIETVVRPDDRLQRVDEEDSEM